jgi:hypothetical protein
MKATSPADIGEQGGKFVYFLKRYVKDGIREIAGFTIPDIIGMEAGAAYEMPDGREVIIHWRHDYKTGAFTDGHVAEYSSGKESAADGWELD